MVGWLEGMNSLSRPEVKRPVEGRIIMNSLHFTIRPHLARTLPCVKENRCSIPSAGPPVGFALSRRGLTQQPK